MFECVACLWFENETFVATFLGLVSLIERDKEWDSVAGVETEKS